MYQHILEVEVVLCDNSELKEVLYVSTKGQITLMMVQCMMLYAIWWAIMIFVIMWLSPSSTYGMMACIGDHGFASSHTRVVGMLCAKAVLFWTCLSMWVQVSLVCFWCSFGICYMPGAASHVTGHGIICLKI